MHWGTLGWYGIHYWRYFSLLRYLWIFFTGNKRNTVYLFFSWLYRKSLRNAGLQSVIARQRWKYCRKKGLEWYWEENIFADKHLWCECRGCCNTSLLWIEKKCWTRQQYLVRNLRAAVHKVNISGKCFYDYSENAVKIQTWIEIIDCMMF